MTRAAQLIAAAARKRVMIATAESCTGGLLAGAITDVAGSSAVFERGFVTYSNAAKAGMLDVPEALIAAHGAVSPEVACAMAAGALARSKAQLAVSVTGIAGPGGSDHKPEGRVCFGLATAQGTITETVEFGARGRDAVRRASVDHALDMLLRAVADQP